MTAQTAEGTSTATQVVPVAPAAIERVTNGKPWNLNDILALVAPAAPEFTQADELPKAAPKVKFTEVLRLALKVLPTLYGKVAPDAPRLLDRQELIDLTAESNAIDAAMADMKKRKESIQEIMRAHQDAQAEEAGLPAGTIRVGDGVAKGHWLVAAPGTPFETAVDGYADCWQQRYTAGKTEFHGSDVHKLYKEGLITRPEWLGFTTGARTYDEDRMAAFVKANPQRGLEIMAMLTTRSAPAASMHSPKK
jgi:hypothetical protein